VFRYHIWYRTYDAATFVDVFAILHQASDPGEIERRLI
jgi:plasmid stabilization system protein ParE